jgi:hypothetical protein
MVGAFGPTLATVFAGVATIAVYRRGEKFQRQLVRPLVVIRHRLNPGHERTLWNVSVKNEGQGAANVEAIGIVAGDCPNRPGPLQSPANYWEQAMNAVGILHIRSVAGFWLDPPVSLAPGAEEQLFEADLGGNGPDVAQGIRRLQIRLSGQSALGERFAIYSSYGHTEGAIGRRARRLPV